MSKFTTDQLTIAMQNTNNVRNFSIVAQVDAGKCFSEGTLIRLSDGSIKAVELLTMNDSVIGLDGQPKRVIEIHQGNGLMYNIKQNSGMSYTVNGQHTLVLKITNNEGIFWDQKRQYYRARYMQNLKLHDKCFQHDKTKEITKLSKQRLYNKAKRFIEEKQEEAGYNGGNDTVEISVEDYLNLPKNVKKALYGFKQGVDFDEKPINLDAYMLGLWLGDGTTTEPAITNADKQIIDHIYNYAQEHNLRVTTRGGNEIKPCITYYIAGTDGKNSNSFLNALKQYNLIGNKHIPHDYLFNSRDVRLAVLAGLIDSDGYMYHNMYEIAQKSDKLTGDIVFLAQSLGFRATFSKRIKNCVKPNGDKVSGVYNVIQISGKLLDELPLILDYKKAVPVNEKNFLVSAISVTPHEVGRYIGFQIEGDGKFFAPDFTVWHNSSLSDSLLCRAGLISKKDAGEKRQTDTMQQEKDRGITIKSVGVSMYIPYNGSEYIINVVDTPGHVDFNSECSCALRITDGAVVLIDTIDGVKAQTRTVLMQALKEMVKPILMINKIDKLFLSLNMDPDAMYDLFTKNVADVNEVIDMYQDSLMTASTGDLKVNPVVGSVVFGSAYHLWGFTLKTFAKMYAQKFGKQVPDLMKYLWKRENFKKFIIEPIRCVLDCCQSHPERSPDGKLLSEIVEKLGIVVQPTDYDLRGKELIRAIMGSWLPVADAVVDSAVDHLPSPVVAQKYRVDVLYNGPHDDIYYNSIKNCDPTGPLIVFVSKMVPTKDNSHFYAFGRVFSGTATATKIKSLMNDHNPLNPGGRTYVDDSVRRVVLMMANRMEYVTSVPVGNTLALDGIDKTMVKSGTVVGADHVNCFPLKNIKFSVSPVVRYSIRPKNPSDIAKFSDTIKKFVKSDPCLQYIYNKESGEHILAGAGELHLEVALEQLQTDFLKSVEIVVSEPVVQYCETVTAESSQVCLSKSANKHNRLFGTAEPLRDDVIAFTESTDMPAEHKERARYIYKNCERIDDPKKVWSFAPDIAPVNIFVNETTGVQYLNEIEGSVNSGFLNTCEKGPLCEEPIRGVRFNLKDAKLHTDKVHRGDNQIPTRSLMFATMLTAQPRLLEPVFGVEISVPREHVSKIYTLMTKRRGMVKNVTPEHNNITMTIEAHLPVAESFGFIQELRGETSGTAFASMVFSHWQIVPGDPLEPGTYANQIMLDVRRRKGRKVEAPKLEDYLDKL